MLRGEGFETASNTCESVDLTLCPTCYGFTLSSPPLFVVPFQDPFADAAGDDASTVVNKDYVHIRVQQRNGRKSLTTVQGIPEKFGKSKILKALKKSYCCNGCVVEDSELGEVIQLQGDQRKNVSDFLTESKIVKKELIKIHGAFRACGRTFLCLVFSRVPRSHADLWQNQPVSLTRFSPPTFRVLDLRLTLLLKHENSILGRASSLRVVDVWS